MDLFVFAGFLGSGKTTLILSLSKRLVEEHGRKVCIIVNEVGKVGIDDKVMRRAGLEVRELYAGCICCQLASDLLITLRKVAEGYDPDIVILEASGIANPISILDALRHYQGPSLGRVRTITVVDPGRFETFMAALTPLATGQIEAANVVALNKADECTPEELASAEAAVRALNDQARLVVMSAREGLNTDPILEEMLPR